MFQLYHLTRQLHFDFEEEKLAVRVRNHEISLAVAQDAMSMLYEEGG